jgi:acetyl esterase/lipase
VARICAAGQATALSLDYALAPERPFPAALEDVHAAYRYLLDEGIAADRIAFAGDSAGANLVLASLIILRDAGEPLPAAAVCISPPTDFTLASESLVTRARLDPLVNVDALAPLCRAYANGASADDPRISPLLADLGGLPPLLLQVGSHEVLYDDSVRFAAKARAAGVDVRLEVGRQLWHVWHATAPYVPEARRAIGQIGAFIREHIPTSEDAPRDISAA